MPADIAVVIGAQNARGTITDCLNSVLGQTNGVNAEILVADGSTDGTDQIVQKDFPNVLLIRAGRENLIPHLWGIGMERAQAPLVALTTGHCIPSRSWLENIIKQASQNKEYAGIGGPIAPSDALPPRDWAVYFSRYSAFMPPTIEGPVKDIPGDNAAYRKDALDRCWLERENGFWETIFHHALHLQGEMIYMTPQVEVRLGRTDSATDYFVTRFKHGVHYGSTRPNNTGLVRLVRIFAAPILMPYLVLRIGRRVARRRPDWLGRYVTALPWLLFFMTGWSLGEIWGYLNPVRNGDG
jgi:glycosyltransferase involved in cell wall biosynthesis